MVEERKSDPKNCFYFQLWNGLQHEKSQFIFAGSQIPNVHLWNASESKHYLLEWKQAKLVSQKWCILFCKKVDIEMKTPSCHIRLSKFLMFSKLLTWLQNGRPSSTFDWQRTYLPLRVLILSGTPWVLFHWSGTIVHSDSVISSV